MAWTACKVQRRTFDPDTGLQLKFLSSGSGGMTSFAILGHDSEIGFSASTGEERLTAHQKETLGVSDALVWSVIRADRTDEGYRFGMDKRGIGLFMHFYRVENGRSYGMFDEKLLAGFQMLAGDGNYLNYDPTDASRCA